MGVKQKKICCPSAAVNLKLPSQIIVSKLLYFLLHFNYTIVNSFESQKSTCTRLGVLVYLKYELTKQEHSLLQDLW